MLVAVTETTTPAAVAWSQIPRYTKMLLGARQATVQTDGSLCFQTTNHGGRRVVVRLNTSDLYGIEIGRIRKFEWQVLDAFENIYADQLVPVLHKAFGEGV